MNSNILTEEQKQFKAQNRRRLMLAVEHASLDSSEGQEAFNKQQQAVAAAIGRSMYEESMKQMKKE